VSTLKYPEIKPVAGPPGDSSVFDMPVVGGVPPPGYKIMEIDIDTTKPVFPVNVVIYDENDIPVFNVSVLLREKNKVFLSTQPL
jgi:hypothetical protein